MKMILRMSLHDFQDWFLSTFDDKHFLHNLSWVIYGATLGVGRFLLLDVQSPMLSFLIAVATAGVGGVAAVIGKNIGILIWRYIEPLPWSRIITFWKKKPTQKK